MGTKMRKLDVAIVGAGAAGIACGLKLLDKGNHNFMIYEKGRSYEKRYCPVDHGRTCMKCDGICNVISGFGGCIHYGDSVKLSVYPSGKRLYQLLGPDAYYSCLEFALEHFFRNRYLEFQMTEGNKITEMDVKDYGICSLDSGQVKEALRNSFDYLESNQCISLETVVKKIEKQEDGFFLTLQRTSGEETVYAAKVVIATGRDGVTWWKEMTGHLGVKAEPPVISLGFRFEMDKKYLTGIGERHPDLKLRFVKGGRKFKTFCFCAGKKGGKLKGENYGDFTLLDGHILLDKDEESGFANFALLMQLTHDRERMTYSQVVSRYIARYKKLGGYSGMPVFQNYSSFRNREDGSEQNGTSLASARPAAVWKLLEPEEHTMFCEVADEIIRWIMEFNGLHAGQIEEFGKKIYILGMEIESLWDTICLDEAMMTTVDGLYVTGDCAGLAQGIIPAAVSGVYVAEKIV